MISCWLLLQHFILLKLPVKRLTDSDGTNYPTTVTMRTQSLCGRSNTQWPMEPRFLFWTGEDDLPATAAEVSSLAGAGAPLNLPLVSYKRIGRGTRGQRESLFITRIFCTMVRFDTICLSLTIASLSVLVGVWSQSPPTPPHCVLACSNSSAQSASCSS